ncbi:MAG TPA: hypothetical protein VFK40_05185 [Nitrososphaeraceae archaeon]|nr:hypothetical protein [Nitrososphaeraceae archaeon]
MKIFNDTPTKLPKKMTISDFPIPYIAHRERPIINTTKNLIDTSSVSFVLSAFLICGIVLATENAVANNPTTVNKASNISK